MYQHLIPNKHINYLSQPQDVLGLKIIYIYRNQNEKNHQ
jgi:hypothetical protein